ncbi:hypothetical protein Poli38472_000993 [Pythium oligandrum]|uniref:1,4-dihydroxy-2-naphthoate octaprenyltransferase n=1 Tax=Pythium oligandrum TaxID=41045 RepID=A0A8K1CCR1_PYTOL|nr:hypothetical protein Poli38472_000993 [Pythium oligandrum]|eukprot:TMW60951.1 hypothetical protein Poli38472_000993 [Pythium oligandrum]
MEMTKSLVAAIRPRSLYASAAPVIITWSLLRVSHDISLLRPDVIATVVVAVVVQILANLNGIYTTFHRAFDPLKATTKQGADGENKIVINLMSQKLVQGWSWIFFLVIMAMVGVIQLTGRRKSQHVASVFSVLAVMTFLYCRHTKPLPAVGLQEFIFAISIGPLAMLTTSFIAIGAITGAVIVYAHIVMLFALSAQILQSAADAPFAHRFGHQSTSLALRLGYQRTYQTFLLLLTASYGVLVMASLTLGHTPNLLLVLTLNRIKDMSEAFREEQLRGLPEQLATLGAILSAGVASSITVSAFIA